MSKLDVLLKDLERAEAAYLAELKRAYPVGKKVLYRLRGGSDADKYPWQEGEVVGYAKDSKRLRVRLAESRGARATGLDRRYVTTLPLSKIKEAK